MNIRVKRLVFITFVSILLVCAVIAVVAFTNNKPPINLIEEGRKVIAEARDLEASSYSPKEMADAEKVWNQAIADWNNNNQKNIVTRKFNNTSKLAISALAKAKYAKDITLKRKKELKNSLEDDICNLKTDINYLKVIVNKLPINHNIRERLTPLTLKFNEAEQAYERKDLLSSKKLIDKVKNPVRELKILAQTIIEGYFSNLPEWTKLNQEMKAWSKKNSSISLVVDKFNKECIVYKGGSKYKTFEVELGVNWLGDKKHSGDKATPEGSYTITAKKSGSATIYYKSLSLNFPNEDDKARFNFEKKRGSIPKGARIGGSIAIHGGGGKGIDWTEGCIALSNKDMDQLYQLCSVGTPVVIVGSLAPFETVFHELITAD